MNRCVIDNYAAATVFTFKPILIFIKRRKTKYQQKGTNIVDTKLKLSQERQMNFNISKNELIF